MASLLQRVQNLSSLRAKRLILGLIGQVRVPRFLMSIEEVVRLLKVGHLLVLSPQNAFFESIHILSTT